MHEETASHSQLWHETREQPQKLYIHIIGKGSPWNWLHQQNIFTWQSLTVNVKQQFRTALVMINKSECHLIYNKVNPLPSEDTLGYYWYCSWLVQMMTCCLMGHIAGQPLLELSSRYPLIFIKSLQLIWRLGNPKWNLWVLLPSL